MKPIEQIHVFMAIFAIIILILIVRWKIIKDSRAIEKVLDGKGGDKMAIKAVTLLRLKNRNQFILKNLLNHAVIFGLFLGVSMYLMPLFTNEEFDPIIKLFYRIVFFIGIYSIFSLYYSLAIWKRFKDKV